MKQTVFACDIGGSKLMCGLVDADGAILDKEKIALPPDLTPDALEGQLMRMYDILTARNPDCTPIACGMTIPGLADAKEGIWVYACFSGISDYPIAKRMGEKLGLPVAIENDVNACALAEQRFGACRDCGDFLWVTVSNGVGGGLVLGGKLYTGAFGGAGEFGHIVVEEDGEPCPCGHRGCMEAAAAGPAIAKRYHKLTGLSKSAAEIADLAREGDADALAVMHKTGEFIGKGLGKAASLLNLERYILGGGVMQSLDLMEKSIRSAFAKEAFERPNRQVKILPTALRYDAGLMGAATMAWNDLEQKGN
ncbi:MAG: ROK family protein [Ruminococcaceae bacterium]|nr:ROK family protein [Oscillospiraceae bacterium]